MKKRIHKLLSLMLTIILVVGMIPMTSLPAFAATGDEVYVGGVAMYDGDYLAVGATATQTTKPSGGYAYYENDKLTLNNYSYEGEGYKYDDYYYAVIYTKNDLTLELIGNNTLTQTASDSDMIYVDGAKLTVGGDGKLTGTPAGYALYADKDITINGGTVEVSTYIATSIVSYGNVIINDGDITAESEDMAAIYSKYDVTVNGGNVTAIGGNGAIDYSTGFTVAEGAKIQASTTVDGELGEYVAANHTTYKKIVINAHKLTAPVIKSSSVANTGKIKLTWAAVEGAAKYRVYRATSKTGKYSIMKTVEGTSYINATAKAGTRYYYYVVSIDANGNVSEKSNIVNRVCDMPRPTVTLSNVASSGKIKVSWTKVDGAAKYQVYRSTTKNGTYKVQKTTTSLSWTDTNTTAGKTYYYKVKAVHSNTNANSALTAYKSRTCDLKRPTVSITRSSGKPKVSWAAVSGATKYKIYRSTSKTGTYSLVKTTTSKSWKDTTAKKGKTYYYKVVAVHKNSSANSAYSTVKSIKCTK